MTRKANSRQETEGSNHRELRDHKEILFVYFALFAVKNSSTTENTKIPKGDSFLYSMFFAVKPDRDSEALDFRAASELLRRTLVDA